jgi:Ca-activated chloride channel family protein
VIDLAQPWWLAALAGVGALGTGVAWLLARRARDVARFVRDVDNGMRTAMALHRIRAVAVVFAVALGVVALARPQWGAAVEPVRARGADVVIAVDVSLSMLARDASPSRIERARLVLLDLLDRLEGHRVGLVAFAGSSGTLLPITRDTDAARMFADRLEVQAVDEPGTSLDSGVTRAVELFEAAAEGERVLVVVSDGEDQGDDPLEVARAAASRAAAANVHVVAVSVGDEAGAEIPLDVLGSATVKRDRSGMPAVTRARKDVLAELAVDGLFVEAASGDDSARVAAFVEAAGQGLMDAGERTIVPDRFQSVLLVVLALLAVEYLVASYRP